MSIITTIFLLIQSLSLFLSLTQSKELIFITSKLINCKANLCDGSILHPYDSFFYAMNNHHFQDNQTYSFIFQPSDNGHYLMLKETLVSNNENNKIYYDYKHSPLTINNTYFINYTNLSLELLGLPCSNFEFINRINAHELCLNNNFEEMIQVYVKDDDFDIVISGNLTIDNILLNGLDILYQFTIPSKDDRNCLTRRVNCCDLENCVDPFSKEDFEFGSLVTRGPLFVYNKNTQGQSKSITWTISNSEISQFGLIKHTCFFEHYSLRIESARPSVRLMIINTTFNGYLSQGLILNEELVNYDKDNDNNNENDGDNTPLLLLPAVIEEYSLELHNVEISLDSFDDENWVNLFYSMGKIYPIAICNGVILMQNVHFIYLNEVIMAKGSYVNITNLSYIATDQYITKNVFDFNQCSIFITNSILFGANIFSELTGNLTNESLDVESLLTLPPEQKKLNVSGISSLNSIKSELNGLIITQSYLIFAKYIQIDQGAVDIRNIVFDNNIMLISTDISISQANNNVTISSCIFNDTVIDAQAIDPKYLEIEDINGVVALKDLKLYGNGWIKANQVERLMIDGLIYEGDKSRVNYPVYGLKIIDTSLDISNSKLSNLISNNGVLYAEVMNDKFLTIKNTSFINNTGIRGGATQIRLYPAIDRDINISIDNCTFQNNSVIYDVNSSPTRAINSGYGAAINLYSDDYLYSNITITNSKFINNTAVKGGGAIFWGTSPPKLMNNTFVNNTAEYGNNVASKPIGILPSQVFSKLINYDAIASQNENQYDLSKLLDLNHFKIGVYKPTNSRILLDTENILLLNNSLQLSDLISGSPINTPLVLYLVDIYGQIVKTENEKAVYLNFKNFSIDEKGPQPKDPNMVIQPRALATFEIITNGVANFSNLTLSYWPDSKLTILFNVSLDKFLPQSLKVDYPNSIQLDATFRDCFYGELFNENTGECFNCTDNICLISYNPSVIDSCMDGYTGNMCTTCVKEDHAFINNECISCTSNPWYYIRYTIVVLIQLLILACSVRYNLGYIQQPIESINEDGNLTIQQMETILSDQLKLLITYLQFFSIIASFQFEWPVYLTTLYSVIKYIGGTPEQYFNLDCFLVLGASQYGDEKTYIKYLIILIIPYIFTILAFIFWVLYFKLKNYRILKNPNFINNLIITLVIAAFIFQPYIIKYSFMLFQCEEVMTMETTMEENSLVNNHTTKYYWTSNYQIQCFTSNHLLWSLLLSIPTLIIWVIILPLLAFMILFKNRKHLDEENSIRSKYSFLYRGYTRDKFYWEFIIMIEKIGLIGIFVFLLYAGISFQAIISTTLMLLAFFIQNRIKPHIYPSLNRLEAKSYISLLTMTISGLYYYTVGFSDKGQDWFIMIMVFITMIYFLLSWIYAFVHMIYKKNSVFSASSTCFKHIFKRLKTDNKESKSPIDEIKVEEIMTKKNFGTNDKVNIRDKEEYVPYVPSIHTLEEIILETRNLEPNDEIVKNTLR